MTLPDTAVQPDGREPDPAKLVLKEEARAGSDGQAIAGQWLHGFMAPFRVFGNAYSCQEGCRTWFLVLEKMVKLLQAVLKPVVEVAA